MPVKQPKPGELDAIETASRDEVTALQLTRLKATLHHAYANVPHYKKSFDAKDVHPDDLKSLADSAFAFACNSYNELTVASGFSIDLLAPGRLNDVLTARCAEVSKAGRTGVYDTTITNQRGERIAMFRGRSYTMKGKPAVPADRAG